MPANLTTKLGQLVDVLTPDTTNTRIGVANASPTRTLDVTGTFGASGASTLGGALTYGGVTLSNAVTGTGNMVLSASPTFTGTLIAAAATIGVNNAYGIYTKIAGGGTVPVFATAGNDTVFFNTNASGVWRVRNAADTSDLVNITNAGLVGIGMTPSNVLDITQTQNAFSVLKMLNSNASGGAGTNISLANGTDALNIYGLGTGYTSSGIYQAHGAAIVHNGSAQLTIGCYQAQPIVFAVSNAEKARFDTSGNLCVGSSSAPSGLTNAVSVHANALLNGAGPTTVANNGTITMSCGGSRFAGFLSVSCVNPLNGSIRTASTYSVFIFDNDFSTAATQFQLIHTANGGGGGSSFTVAYASTGFLITNTSGGDRNLQASLVGTIQA
jgi:hypothetical protein